MTHKHEAESSLMLPKEVALVRQGWKAVLGREDEFGERFYRHLFEHDSGLQKLFHRSMEMQAHKAVNMFTTVIESLDSPIRLFPPVYAAGRRHELNYGVTWESYATMRRAFIETMKEMQLPEWDEEHEMAWNRAFMLIADVMTGAMPDLD